MPFFNIFASPRWSPLRMRTKVASFFIFFQELSNKKKIKALRPKMTKIASRGSCLKSDFLKILSLNPYPSLWITYPTPLLALLFIIFSAASHFWNAMRFLLLVITFTCVVGDTSSAVTHFLSLEGNRTPAAVGDPKPLMALQCLWCVLMDYGLNWDLKGEQLLG